MIHNRVIQAAFWEAADIHEVQDVQSVGQLWGCLYEHRKCEVYKVLDIHTCIYLYILLYYIYLYIILHTIVHIVIGRECG